MERIEKSWKDLDLDTVDFGESIGDGQWSFSAGGSPHESGEWSIYTYNEDDVEVRYKLPECINRMLALQRKWGDDEATGRIRNALRI